MSFLGNYHKKKVVPAKKNILAKRFLTPHINHLELQSFRYCRDINAIKIHPKVSQILQKSHYRTFAPHM